MSNILDITSNKPYTHVGHEGRTRNGGALTSTMGTTNKVRYHRFLRDEMSQAGLAERVGVSRQTIVAIERGNYNPSIELALRVARELGVPVEELFQLAEDTP